MSMSNISSFINNKYVITTFIIGLIIWIILIFVGMGYITDKVIKIIVCFLRKLIKFFQFLP